MATARPLTFGDLLKRHRLNAHLTQEELAERANVSPQAISQLERGARRAPRRDTVLLLAAALGLAPTDQERFMAVARGRDATSTVVAPLAPSEPLPRAAPGQAQAPTTTAAPPTTPAYPHSERASSATGGVPPFVGRNTELALIARMLTGEAPPVLALSGEPGIGKTRLLREAAQMALDLGWSVLRGGCHRRSGQEPYAPFIDLLATSIRSRSPAQLRGDLVGCAWLARLLPELSALGKTTPAIPSAGSLTPAQERRLVFDAASHYISNSAGPLGTLLLLDDLQWIGDDALDLLAAVIAAPSECPLRVIVAYRDTEVPADHPLALLLFDLWRADHAARHEVAPLSHEDAASLVETLLASDSGIASARAVMASRLVKRAGGVPFFLICYAQGLRLGAPDGSISGSVPRDVAQAIRQRLMALPLAAREVLGVGAIIGQQIPARLLTTVARESTSADLDERALLAGVDAACQARLLVPAGDEAYQFAHELIREVIRADLGAARRALLHLRVATALEHASADPPADVLAYHYGRAGEHAKAVRYLERAGDRAAAMRAHAAACGYYQELAERLTQLDRGAEAAHAREKLGMLHKDLAQYGQALRALEAAAAGYRAVGDTEGWLRATAQIGATYARQGMPHDGLARLHPLLDALAAQEEAEQRKQTSHTDADHPLPQSISVAVRATAYIVLAQLHRVGGQYDAALAAAERAVPLADAAGDPRLRAWAQGHRGWALLMLSRTREATPTLELAVRLAETTGDLNSLSYALNEVAIVHELHGEIPQYRAYVERALQVAEQLGDPSAVALMRYNRADAAFLAGDWQSARDDLEQALATLRATDSAHHAPWPLFGLGQLALVQGEWDEGERLLAQSIVMAEKSANIELLRTAHSLLAERDLLAGHPHAAAARLLPLLDRSDQHEIQVTPFLPLVAWARLECGEAAEAEALLAQTIARADAAQLRQALVTAWRVQAVLEMRRSCWPQAEHLLARARDLSRTMGVPYAEARVLFTYGRLAALRGAPDAAEETRRWMRAALDILQPLGERLYAEQAQYALAPAEHASN